MSHTDDLHAGDGSLVTIPSLAEEVVSGAGPDGTNEAVGGHRGSEEELLRTIVEREALLAEREQALRLAVRDRELMTVLARSPLVPGVAEQLLKLWREEFTVVVENDAFRVTAHDGRSVDAVVTEWLARREYGHFCVPSSRGGVATGGRGGSAMDGASSRQATLGEEIIRSWQESARSPGVVQGPFGLRKRR